jgi:hypothetical protein
MSALVGKRKSARFRRRFIFYAVRSLTAVPAISGLHPITGMNGDVDVRRIFVRCRMRPGRGFEDLVTREIDPTPLSGKFARISNGLKHFELLIWEQPSSSMSPVSYMDSMVATCHRLRQTALRVRPRFRRVIRLSGAIPHAGAGDFRKTAKQPVGDMREFGICKLIGRVVRRVIIRIAIESRIRNHNGTVAASPK